MTDGLKPKHRDAIIEKLSSSPKVERIVLFGSRAMGTFTPTSDVDIALFGDNLTLGDQAALSEIISELSIPQRVDLLVHHRIENQALLEHIRKHGIEWYSRNPSPCETSEMESVNCSSLQFGDCADLIRDTVNPSDVCGLPYIGLEHIAENLLTLSGYGFAEQVTSIKYRFKKGDILFGKLRPYFRKVIIAPFDGICSTDIWVVRPKDAVDSRFLFYLMSSPDFIEVSSRASEGTRMPRAKWEFLAQMNVVLPSLKVQRAIAHILGSLDDKIELNRRMNKTLEDMARAIYKSWFVDFDPVRAKAEGRDPNLPPHIAALFPDSFEDSELGPIPKGWRVGSVGEILSISRDSILPGDFPWEHFDHYSIPAFDNGQNPISETGSSIKSQKLLVKNDCILVSKLNPKIPRIWIPEHYNGKQRIASTEFLVCLPKRSLEISCAFLFLLCGNSAFIEYLTNLASGTSNSHQRVLPADFLSYKCAISSRNVLHAIDGYAKPLFDRVLALKKHSISLATLRDTLLPKLISGELRIKAAEKIAGRCL